MPRIKRGVTTRQKHKRLLEQAKGYVGPVDAFEGASYTRQAVPVDG